MPGRSSGIAVGAAPSKPVADWRLTEEEAELSAPNPRESLWQRLGAWFFLVAGLVYLVAIARMERTEGEVAISTVKAVVMIGISQAALMLLLQRLSNQILSGPGLKRIRVKIPIESAQPVRMTVCQKGTVTGMDEGYMWVDDGTLFYKGLQTVWRLNAEDLPPTDRWPAALRPRPGSGREIRCLPFNFGSREAQVRFVPIDPFEDFGTRRRAHVFQQTLIGWITDRPAGTLETVLPPLELHPGLRRSGFWVNEGPITGVLLCLANGGLALLVAGTFGVDSLRGTSDLLILALAGAGMFFSVRFLAQQWRDRTMRRAVFLENQFTGLL